jgi:protein-S-isoprenylcysteine O-methyltransferase Ste14
MHISMKRLAFAIGWTAMFVVIVGGGLCLIAGRWYLPWFWGYVGVYALFILFACLSLDAGLIRERLRPGPHAQDKVLLNIGKLVSLAHFAIAALDVGRFHWSDTVPAAAQAAGLAVLALTFGAILRAMLVNPFFSTVVRIQEERGHRVITDGPYRIVRHPGYAVACPMMLASGVALGSWYSIIPMVAMVLLMIRRTAIEDRFLHEHLPGYADYAQRVRYKLLPGVW